LAAVIGQASRFPTGAHFKSYLGLTPRASETGNTDRKGQPMSKAGSRLLRSTLIRAADHARKQDPQLARIYYLQMVERGANHLKALCVVAARLAERAWTVMHRRMPLGHLRHHRRTRQPERAKQIIAEQWAVPADVGTRRRSRKTATGKTAKGKAPQQVHPGHDKPYARGTGKRGDLPHPRSSARTTNTSSTPAQRTGSGHALEEGTGR
jgi:Transposase IS116/IS110/IS902 family